ncbi:MAG: heme/hemin ABC transporter substrate-binding protein [Allorhizobium sp.]
MPGSAQGLTEPASRIVSIGGTVTEIIYALGAGERIVAVDTTSLFPAEVSTKPNVGYMRNLSAEGIIAQHPDLIIAEAGSGPPDTIAILQASGIPFISIPTPPRVDGIVAKIRAVGAAIGKDAQSEQLAATVSPKLAALADDLRRRDGERRRVLFLLSASNGRLMAAGTETAAAAMIELAGGTNAAASIAGYKPMSDEAVIAMAPEVIIMMENGGSRMTADELFSLPALASSPAARDQALIQVDGLYMLGFGPRTADAARDLARSLYPQAAVQ